MALNVYNNLKYNCPQRKRVMSLILESRRKYYINWQQRKRKLLMRKFIPLHIPFPWLIIDCNDIQQSPIKIKKHRHGISSVKYTKIAIENPFAITQRPSIIPAPIHRSRTNKTGQNIRATDDNVDIAIPWHAGTSPLFYDLYVFESYIQFIGEKKINRIDIKRIKKIIHRAKLIPYCVSSVKYRIFPKMMNTSIDGRRHAVTSDNS